MKDKINILLNKRTGTLAVSTDDEKETIISDKAPWIFENSCYTYHNGIIVWTEKGWIDNHYKERSFTSYPCRIWAYDIKLERKRFLYEIELTKILNLSIMERVIEHNYLFPKNNPTFLTKNGLSSKPDHPFIGAWYDNWGLMEKYLKIKINYDAFVEEPRYDNIPRGITLLEEKTYTE